MTQPQPASLGLRTQLCSVDDAVSNCDPEDYFSITRMIQQLEALHRQLEREQMEHLAPLADLARHVGEILGSDGQLSAGATLQLIEAMVDIVQAALGLTRDEDEREADATPVAGEGSHEAQPSPELSARRPGLQLVANKRLGEMLTQMSMLSPKQVEAALEQQRVTGCRFGDALVQMKLLSREAVESALRMQRTRRRTDQNPWAAR